MPPGFEGRTQVNKALHTCTSRYAYAAMWRQFHWIYTESLSSVGGTPLSNASLPHGPTSDHVAPCVTFRRVVVPLRGPGQSPVLPFACCVGSLRSVGRCGRCSCWCRFRVRGAQ